MSASRLQRQVAVSLVVATASATACVALLMLVVWPVSLRPELISWWRVRGAAIALSLVIGAGSGALIGWSMIRSRFTFLARLAHDLDLMRTSRPDLRAGEDVPAELAAAVNAFAVAHEAQRRDSAAQIALATEHLAEERDLLAAVLAKLSSAVIACTRDGRVLLYTPAAAQLVQRMAPEHFLGLGRSIFSLFRRSAIVHGLTRMDMSDGGGSSTGTATALLSLRNGNLLHARFSAFSGSRLQGFFLELQTFDARPQRPVETQVPLEDMTVQTLLSALRTSLESRVTCDLQIEDSETPVWVAAESFSLSAVLRDFCAHLGVAERVRLSVGQQQGGAAPRLQFCWQPPAPVCDDVWTDWLQTPLSAAGYHLPLTPSDVAQLHGGAITQRLCEAWACLELPLRASEAVSPTEQAQMPSDATQVEFSARVDAAGVERLDALTYTVFDTETTGLDPSGGDQIIAIGAIRILGGRMRSTEVFETLVNTSQRIDPAAERVHGIAAEMLLGQPTAAEALPRFRAFCDDTVLVAHNAAFDRRFLELQSPAAGVEFALPVLDTLLLSELIYPDVGAHGLEAIAERLGISIVGRHTALGDAILTAEIFLRLLPLLRGRGIVTLQDALSASRLSRFAELRY